MLHEIARHRAVFGESVRRSLQEIEDAEFKELEIDDRHAPKNPHDKQP